MSQQSPLKTILLCFILLKISQQMFPNSYQMTTSHTYKTYPFSNLLQHTHQLIHQVIHLSSTNYPKYKQYTTYNPYQPSSHYIQYLSKKKNTHKTTSNHTNLINHLISQQPFNSSNSNIIFSSLLI